MFISVDRTLTVKTLDLEDYFSRFEEMVAVKFPGLISEGSSEFHAGVNEKPNKFKAVWDGFWGIVKLCGRVNQASLKLSAGFPNTVTPLSVCQMRKSLKLSVRGEF